jgi:micrococcal nuclease
MPVAVSSKGAAAMVAPFAFRLLLTSFLFAGYTHPVLASACPTIKTSERVQVVYVYDGDTVKLKDGRRLRLIGINTPEVGHKGTPVQPLAETARAALQDLLDTHNGILLLQYGQQDHDHYGRLLAHVFLEDGGNVAVSLLQQGLATTLVVPPNVWGIHCYQTIENEARRDRKGLWALPGYQPQQAHPLPLNTRGFHIVQGRVTGLRNSRYTVWIDIDGPLVLQVAKKDLDYFGSLETLVGQQIEARGWIKQDRDDGLRMKIRHPAALVAITGTKQHH